MARLQVSIHGVTKVEVKQKHFKNYVSQDLIVHYNDYDGTERTTECTLYSDDGVSEIPHTLTNVR